MGGQARTHKNVVNVYVLVEDVKGGYGGECYCVLLVCMENAHFISLVLYRDRKPASMLHENVHRKTKCVFVRACSPLNGFVFICSIRRYSIFIFCSYQVLWNLRETDMMRSPLILRCTVGRHKFIKYILGNYSSLHYNPESFNRIHSTWISAHATQRLDQVAYSRAYVSSISRACGSE